MKNIFILAITMMVLGVAVLGYDHYSYTTTEQILQIGPITASAEKTHTVWLSPFLGWLLIGGGLFVLALTKLYGKR